MVEQHPILATYVGLHDGDARLDDATRDAVVQEIADAHRHRARAGGDRPGRAVGQRPLRARAGPPQRPARALRHGGPSRLGAPLHCHGRRRRRSLLRLRPRLRPAGRAARVADRAPGGRARVPRSAQDPRHGAPGPALAGARDRVRRGHADPVRRGQGRRPRRAGRARPGPPGQGRREGLGRGGRLRRDPQGEDGLHGRELGARLRGLRPAREPARLRRPGRLADPRDRRAAAGPQQGRARGRRPAHRPERRRAHGRGPRQVQPPRHLRRGAGGLQGRHDAGPGPHHRARHRHDARRRADLRHPDARSTCARSSRSPPTSSRPSSTRIRRASTSSRRPSRDDPNAHARAQLRLDQQHQRPRGLPGPPPPALGRDAPTRRSSGCSPTPPSSSRAGACTASR